MNAYLGKGQELRMISRKGTHGTGVLNDLGFVGQFVCQSKGRESENKEAGT